MSRFYFRAASDRPSISIVASDVLLGPLSADRFQPLFATRRAVRAVDLELAAHGWETFTASSPSMLADFSKTEIDLFAAPSYVNDATVALPHLHRAMRRWLEEYPSATQFSGTELTDGLAGRLSRHPALGDGRRV